MAGPCRGAFSSLRPMPPTRSEGPKYTRKLNLLFFRYSSRVFYFIFLLGNVVREDPVAFQKASWRPWLRFAKVWAWGVPWQPVSCLKPLPFLDHFFCETGSWHLVMNSYYLVVTFYYLVVSSYCGFVQLLCGSDWLLLGSDLLLLTSV